MMHGHPAQPHPLHPPHQPPPPHLTHLTSVPPPNMQREHHGNRIKSHHHHQRTVDHMPPHLSMHQNLRKPPTHYTNGLIHSNIQHQQQQQPHTQPPPKPLPLTAPHHPPPALNINHPLPPHQHQHSAPTVVSHGAGKTYGSPHGLQQQKPPPVHHQSGGGMLTSAPIPVVSAATPAGTKTRLIPSVEPKVVHNNANAQIPPPTVVNVASANVHQQAKHQVIQVSATNIVPVVSGNGPTIIAGGSSISSKAPETNQKDSAVQQPQQQQQTHSQMQPQQQHQLQASSSTETLANIKEKTPMCLVNELARYNKIQHQYRLTGETGPAHKKRFTVTLKLGDEEYTAEGPSIKKAQHSAAGDAIGATKYKHPPAKANRCAKAGGKTNVFNITPTVELNALAMKRGEPTVYETEQVIPAAPKYGHGHGMMANGHHHHSATSATLASNGAGQPGGSGGGGYMTAPPPAGSHYGGGNYHHRNANPYSGRYDSGGGTGPGASSYNRRMDTTATTGGLGRGASYNHHNSHAPHHSQSGTRGSGYYNNHLSPASTPELYKVTLHVGERTFLGEGHTLQAARHDAAARALEVLKPLTPEQNSAASCMDTSIDSDDPNSELKSPISLVHEMALKRKLSVMFEVQSEKGPPHMKVFVTVCKVGSIATEGEGNGKKLSKKRAAEKMLEELRKLPPPSPEKNVSRKVPVVKKKTRNLIKEKSEVEISEKVNPISRLMQIQQARKEKEPVYALLEERGVARKRQFTIEVSVSGKNATGTGPTKKIAKKCAAENLLNELGYASASPANKENESANGNEIPEKTAGRKVTFVDVTDGSAAVKTGSAGANGRQNVAGILVVNSGNSRASTGGKSSATNQPSTAGSADTSSDNATADDSMASNSSGVSSASNNSTTTSTPPAPTTPKTTAAADVGQMKEQLMYLAQLLKFDVLFSDFPKGNHGEYLTLVTLSTDPPQLCHGSGASLEQSHDEAARGALQMLSKIGLDNVKPKGSSNSHAGNVAADDTGTGSSVSAAANGPQKQ